MNLNSQLDLRETAQLLRHLGEEEAADIFQIAQIEIDCDAVIAAVNGGCDTVVLG